MEGRAQVTSGLSAFANYTYATAKFREGAFADNDVPLVPRNAVKLGATWEFMPRTQLSGLVTYTGEQVFDGDEANTFGRKMPSYIDWVLGSSIVTMSGLPAVSMPCGFTKSGLPVGLMLVGKPRGEAGLISAAKLFEDMMGIAKRLPIDPIVRH